MSRRVRDREASGREQAGRGGWETTGNTEKWESLPFVLQFHLFTLLLPAQSKS